MAKQKNFPKPLYLNRDALELFRMKFLYKVKMNFFSNTFVYTSDNIENKNIPYLLGELHSICVDDSWKEEKNNFTTFISSREDYDNALNGIYSNAFLFFIKRINQKQTLEDEKKNKLTADVYIILEEDFILYHRDRANFIKYKKIENHFDEEILLSTMQEQPMNKLF
ncbi:hypothetical protein [Riemerella columbipharyngis]|uniref:Uncharacterized protein n=1 Tax=Riemerella columbipharyngis TaxID=1071918 RepID=A0A1G7E0T4_9FLAO|nr:hypothetical protein [Riemerella columbipharyngis]SDE57333.1 hypothetical protein SAMN05421544_11362 [Riemerella columbipharyngis]